MARNEISADRTTLLEIPGMPGAESDLPPRMRGLLATTRAIYLAEGGAAGAGEIDGRHLNY